MRGPGTQSLQAALQEEVAKLRSELGEMAKTVEQAEVKRKEKEDLAKHALAELQVSRDKEREEMARTRPSHTSPVTRVTSACAYSHLRVVAMASGGGKDGAGSSAARQGPTVPAGSASEYRPERALTALPYTANR